MDKARNRILFNDRGDIVIYDAATGARRQVTKTSGGEGNPRWARNDTHVTYVSGGNLFILPVDGSGTLVTQLTDVTQRRPEPRLTESQQFIKTEEQKLIEHVRKEAELGRSGKSKLPMTAAIFELAASSRRSGNDARPEKRMSSRVADAHPAPRTDLRTSSEAFTSRTPARTQRRRPRRPRCSPS